MTPKHTPTPWEFGLGLVSVKQIAMFFGPPLLHPTSRHVGQVFGGDSPQSHANAAFIVKACNLHDKMVAILKTLYEDQAVRLVMNGDQEAWVKDIIREAGAE